MVVAEFKVLSQHLQQAMRKMITNHYLDSQPPGLSHKPFGHDRRCLNHSTVAMSGNKEHELLSQH